MTHYIDKKFKKNRISVNFLVPLKKETATANAIISCILRKSNKTYPNINILAERLEDLYGATLATSVTKIGAAQVISISITCLDDAYAFDDTPILKNCCELLLDIIKNPNLVGGNFKEEDFILERNSIINCLNAELNDKRVYAINSCARMLNGDDPSSMSKYGTIEDANKLKYTDLKNLYEKLINESKVEIFFVGPGDYKVAENILNVLENKNKIETPLPRIFPNGDIITKKEIMNVVQSKMVLGFRCGDRIPFGKHYAKAIGISILGGTPSSLLFKNVREKKSLCYYCSARFNRLESMMFIDCGVENENIEKAKEAILSEFNDLKNGKFDDSVLEFTKLQILNSFKSIYDNKSDIEDYYLSHIYLDEEINLEKSIDEVKKITKEEVVDAVKDIQFAGVYVLTNK